MPPLANWRKIEDLVGAATWNVILDNIASGYEKHFEGLGVKKDGHKFHCLMAGRSYRYRGKDLRGAVFRDISARKKLETQLYQAQKMRALGTLAGGVAHDLNNILSGVVGYPDLLLQDLPADSNLRQPMLTIQQSGLKAAAIAAITVLPEPTSPCSRRFMGAV